MHTVGIVARHGRLERVVLVDVNPGQLFHFATLCRTMLASPDRPSFVQTWLGIRLGRHARKLLMDDTARTPGRIVGSVSGRRSLGVERQFWADVKFHPDAFEAVHGRSAWTSADGLEMHSRLFGRELTQSIHVLGCRPNAPGTYPCTLSYGRGFLASESAYHATRLAVGTAGWAFVEGGLPAALPPVLEALSGFRVVLAVSNVFHEFFTGLDPALADLAVFLAHDWRGGILIADRREPESIHSALRNMGRRDDKPKGFPDD